MYKALPDGLFINESSIAGQGIFTRVAIDVGTELGMSHLIIDNEIIRTPLGGFINHSDHPNCEKYLIDNRYYVRVIRPVVPMEELFLKYTFYTV
tara:strand:- start:1357 stop:1638 length:282 start_codon:yes stop_codon:yes gene_type:complete